MEINFMCGKCHKETDTLHKSGICEECFFNAPPEDVNHISGDNCSMNSGREDFKWLD